MTKANQLRVGNWVMVNNEKYHPNIKGVMLEITSITETFDLFDKETTHSISLQHVNKKQNTYYEKYSQLIRFIDPIPLTPEILEKCKQFGRTVINGEDCFFNGDDVIVRAKDMYLFLHNEVDGSVWGIRRIEHVHEFQNLIMDLTKEELIINL